MSDPNDVEIAKLQVIVMEQGKQIDKLATEVDKLVAVMNRGQGAFGAAMVIAAGVGAAAAKFIPVLFER